MPKIIDSRTVLAVRNLQTSTEYYTTVLGFTQEPIGDGFWSFLTRDSISLLLGKCPDEKPASEIGDHSYVLYLYVEGIDELYEQLIGRGAQIASAPEDTDWGLREFSLVTPDGHRIRFGEPIPDKA